MLRFSQTTASVAAAAALSFCQVALADDLAGVVRPSGQPLSEAKVTLLRTAGMAAPSSIAEALTNASSAFEMTGVPEGKEGIYYLTTKSGPRDAVALLSVLVGDKIPPAAVVNELTTVASVFTNARSSMEP
jgi:hypothetical protein